MKSRRINWVPVVTGLIQKDGKVLLGLRPEGTNLAGLWEFPGGKIEIEESPDAALQRELKEELDIDVDIGPLAFASSHNYGDTGILLLFYRILFWRGEPKPNHHTELKWVKPSELWDFKIPEANRKILGRIIETLEEC